MTLSRYFKRLSTYLGAFLSFSIAFCSYFAVGSPPDTIITYQTGSNDAFGYPHIETPLTKTTFTYKIIVREIRDGHFRIVPDDCLLDLRIDNRSVTSSLIPFCDPDNGRILDLSGELTVGTHTISVDIFNTYGSGTVTLTPSQSPLSAVLSHIQLPFLLLAIALICTARFIPIRVNEVTVRWTRTVLLLVITLYLIFYGLVPFAGVVSPHSLEYWFILLVIASVIGLWWFMSTVPDYPVQRQSSSAISVYSVINVLAALSFIAFCSHYTILVHNALQSHAFDLGIQENVLWNTLHGAPFVSSVMANIPYLGNHTIFIYVLLLPLYALVSRPETLLIAQAVLIGSAAIPLYSWSRSKLESDWQALSVSLIYLLSPAIQGAVFYDFHELCFVPFILFSALWAHGKGKTFLFWGAILLSLLVKEDVSLVVGTFGLFLFYQGNIRRGIQLVLLGSLSYYVLQHGVIPAFSGESRSYVWYFHETFPGIMTPADLMSEVISNPITHLYRTMKAERFIFLLQVLGTVLFLPLSSLGGLIACSYGLFLVLFGGTPALYTQGFQYVFNWIPLLIIVLVYQLASFKKFFRNGIPLVGWSVCGILTLSTLFFLAYGMISPALNFKAGFNSNLRLLQLRGVDEQIREINELAQMVPVEEGVIVNEAALTHLARRPKIIPAGRYSEQLGLVYNYLLIHKREVKQDWFQTLLLSRTVINQMERGEYVLYMFQKLS